jgi:Na+-translocating ferredoxin:NAD+ oxidoreductase RnfG subunit
MRKANGLGKNIENAIGAMKAEYKNRQMSKKELFDFAVAAAGGEMEVTKRAERAIWAAVYRTWRDPKEIAEYPKDYRNYSEYR